jgi:hypothetical protein
MKRYLVYTAALIILIGAASSCKKQIANDYNNPESTTTGSLAKLMSGMFLNNRIHPTYWDYYTWNFTGEFSQFVATSPAAQMYVPNASYVESRWDDYYDGSNPTLASGSTPDYDYDGPGIMSNYREMQTTYAALTASEQAEQYVFLQCAKVLFYDQTAQMVDLWGDIPFFQAGSLNISRTVVAAPFDDAATIYDTLITGLAQLNTYFDTATLSTEIQSELTAQDLLCGGQLGNWQRYANSLRLRLLMRTSYYDASNAQTQVTTMLNNPSTYPLISSNSYNVLLNMSPTTLESNLLSAFTSSPYAPAYILDTLMVANGDPRTTVFWDSVAGQSYQGFPGNGTSAQYSAGGYATYDSATFMYNYNIPGVVFTAAEVSFLEAEANLRWGAGSLSAAAAYAQGINQSIAFYYGINQAKDDQSGYSAAALTSPTQAAIDAYIANVALTGSSAQQLALIATQNWLNFFILQPGQAWAEIRRTGYPVLYFPTASYAEVPQPPNRMVYPQSEQLYNATNYAKVSASDTYSTKIFWDVN